MATEQKPVPPLGVRMPDDLREWLKKQAAANSRSLNQEVVHRLKRSREMEDANAETHS